MSYKNLAAMNQHGNSVAAIWALILIYRCYRQRIEEKAFSWLRQMCQGSYFILKKMNGLVKVYVRALVESASWQKSWQSLKLKPLLILEKNQGNYGDHCEWPKKWCDTSLKTTQIYQQDERTYLMMHEHRILFPALVYNATNKFVK